MLQLGIDAQQRSKMKWKQNCPEQREMTENIKLFMTSINQRETFYERIIITGNFKVNLIK